MTDATLAIEEPTLEERIDHALALRERKKELETQAKELDAEFRAEKRTIIEMMEVMGLTKGGTDNASCSINRKEVPTLTDAEAVKAYILRTGNVHLLQKRISSTVFNELVLLEPDGIPGIETTEVVDLNLRIKK